MKRTPGKKKIEGLKKQLLRKPTFVWDVLAASDKKKAFAFSEAYKRFLDSAKTEREAVQTIERFAVEKGFRNVYEGRRLDSLFRRACGRSG